MCGAFLSVHDFSRTRSLRTSVPAKDDDFVIFCPLFAQNSPEAYALPKYHYFET